MRHVRPLFLLSFALIALAFQSAVVTAFRAELNPANKSEVMVAWTVSQGESIVGFRLQRSLRTESSYDVIHAVQVNPGELSAAPREFTYVDRSVFKPGEAGDAVFYKLQIVYANGAIDERGPVTVNYTSTAIRRTWGSIKSMFQ